jgi:hypothetical protein
MDGKNINNTKQTMELASWVMQGRAGNECEQEVE